MGLDMYLEKSKYFSKHGDKNNRPKVEGFEDSESLTVSGQVMYWRKANAIHKWFVDKVQDGEDNCQRSWVSTKQLKELLEEVTKAIETKDTSSLEPQSGFFFGSTDIDEYYWEDMKETKEGLTRILNEKDVDKYDYYYQASW
jgi:hypothetical protein